MRIIKWVAIVTVLAGIAAYFTRPGPEEFDDMLRAALMQRIAEADVSPNGDAVETVALVGCKLRPTECFQALRAALDVTFTEKLFTTEAAITGVMEASCTGAFTKYWCTKDLAQP